MMLRAIGAESETGSPNVGAIAHNTIALASTEISTKPFHARDSIVLGSLLLDAAGYRVDRRLAIRFES